MDQSFEFSLRPSLFHSKKTLLITPHFVEWDNINFSKFEMAELRYGVKGINGVGFINGRRYCIDIRSLTGKIITIRFITLYGVGKKALDEKFNSILQALFTNFINEIAGRYLESFYKKIDFILLGVVVSQEGIQLNNKFYIIPWADVGTKRYWHYCTLFSNSQPSIYKAFTYLTDWNTGVLYSVVRAILKRKNLLEE